MSRAAAERRRQPLGLGFALVMLLALTACRTGPSDRAANASALGADSSHLLKAEPTGASSTGTAKATDPGPIALSGQGADPGRAVSLGDGLAIFRADYQGTEHFRVTLLDEKGQTLDVIAAADGAYDGSYATNLGDPCACTLAVEADGAWAIRVEQPTPTSGRALPTRYEGQGDRAADFFQADHGLVRFRATHRGAGPFRFTLLTADGKALDRLAQADGDYDGARTVEVDQGTSCSRSRHAGRGLWTWGRRERRGADAHGSGGDRDRSEVIPFDDEPTGRADPGIESDDSRGPPLSP